MEQIKEFLTNILSGFQFEWITVLAIIAFFIGWTLNAYGIANFNLEQLQGMYITLRGAGLVEHGINSGFNSRKGEMPSKAEMPSK